MLALLGDAEAAGAVVAYRARVVSGVHASGGSSSQAIGCDRTATVAELPARW